MKVKEIMSRPVIRIRPEEPVAVAARTLEHYNIGALPVCGGDGKLCGVVTDRDLTVRCLAAGQSGELTRVRDVMTSQITSITPDTELDAAAALMARIQVRRLPVTENGRLCGMLSLADLAGFAEGADTLTAVSSTLSRRK